MGFDLPVMNRLRRSGRALSPASLFATGAQGAIYDPRDLSTMFQDDAGVTPVTAPGQTVGLRLDKSKNGIGSNGLSRRNLVQQTESVNNVYWIKQDVDITVNATTAPDGTLTAEKITPTAVSTTHAFYRLNIVSSQTYTMSFYLKSAGYDTTELLDGTNASNGALFNSSTGTVTNRGTGVGSMTSVGNGWYRCVVTTTTTGMRFYVPTPAGNFTGDGTSGVFIWGIQLELGSAVTEYQRITSDWVATIPGNHAVQATAGDRLTYGIEPKTGRRNLLTFSEDYTNAFWTKTGATVIANSTAAPDGTITASTLSYTGALPQVASASTTVPAGSSLVLTAYAKAGTKSSVELIMFSDGSNYVGVSFNLLAGTAATPVSAGTRYTSPTASIVNVGNGWYRCAVLVNTNTLTSVASWLRGNTMVGVGDNIYLWGAQLETGAVATPYQKVVTAFEVTEAGIPTCHYCAYAGANSMATAAIDFTATDKMSIFVGIRKNNDATFGLIFELSASWTANTGTFLLGNTTGGVYESASGGSVVGVGDQIARFTAAAPDTAVISTTHDIAGDLSTIRRNSVAGTSSTADKGTGNYGNHILYMGRRAGSTLPFTGRDYGIVIVGKATSAAEINITEAWLAANTPTVVL